MVGAGAQGTQLGADLVDVEPPGQAGGEPAGVTGRERGVGQLRLEADPRAQLVGRRVEADPAEGDERPVRAIAAYGVAVGLYEAECLPERDMGAGVGGGGHVR